jgi:solute carrier family 25 citrate transporter 1
MAGDLTRPLAGLGAGLTEAVFAVTPSETIKWVALSCSRCQADVLRTKLVEDSKLAQPRFKGLVHGTGIILREEGFGGVYRGLLPVVSLSVCNALARS